IELDQVEFTAVTLSNCGNGRSNCARETVGLESIPGPTWPANGFGTRSRSEVPMASAESGNWLSVGLPVSSKPGRPAWPTLSSVGQGGSRVTLKFSCQPYGCPSSAAG